MATDEYVKDIEIIKNLLIKQRKTPIIESWAFFLWACLIAIGATVHFILHGSFFDNSSLIISIWIPVSLVGITGETLGWLKSRQKNFLYLFSETNLALLFALFIISIFGTLIFFVLKTLDGLHFAPFFIASLVGLAMGFLGVFLTSWFYGVSIVLLALTTILFFLPFSNSVSSYICGILVSFAMASAGIINLKVLKGKKDVS